MTAYLLYFAETIHWIVPQFWFHEQCLLVVCEWQHLRSIFSALNELLCKFSMNGLSSCFHLLMRLLTRVLHVQVKLVHKVFSHERDFMTWEPIIISARRWIVTLMQQAPKLFISTSLLQHGSLPSFDSLVTTLNWVSMIVRLFLRLKTLMTLLSSSLTFLYTDSIGLPFSL